jgi:hypothetical protein
VIIAISLGTAVVLILGLIALTAHPKFDSETPQPQTPATPRPKRPTELTTAERDAWQLLVAELEADRA